MKGNRHGHVQACICHADLEARLDDRDRQHDDACHRPGPASQQHGARGPRAAVLEEVLLQGIVGAEVEPHSRDGPSKGLERGRERESEEGKSAAVGLNKKKKTSNERRWREDILTGETPFQSPSSLSVRTTLRSTAIIPTLPELKEEGGPDEYHRRALGGPRTTLNNRLTRAARRSAESAAGS